MSSDAILQNGNRRILTLCIGVTIALNTPSFFILKEHWDEMETIRAVDRDIRTMIDKKTENRYYRRDAESDFSVVNERFNNVLFRFQRNEANIQQCLNFIENHREYHP